MFTDEMREEAFEFFCDDCELELYESEIKQKEMEKSRISGRLKRRRIMAKRKNEKRLEEKEAVHDILGFFVTKSHTKAKLKSIRSRRDRRRLNAKIAELESA